MAVDTPVTEKANAHPTDARLYERAREQLVVLALDAGVDLLQVYVRFAPRLSRQVGRYAHARQIRPIRKAQKKLKGYTGRVMRNLSCHLNCVTTGPLRDQIITQPAVDKSTLGSKNLLAFE